MANANSTLTEKPYQISPGFYAIPQGTAKCEIRNHLTARLSQLQAMLEITYGNGAEVFQNWSADIQDNYLWGCAALARECLDLSEVI